MARFFATIFVGAWLFVSWSACFTTSHTVEQQLEQLGRNYAGIKEMLAARDSRLEGLERQNTENQKVLDTQLAQMEKLELKIQQQESLLLALGRDSITSTDGTEIDLALVRKNVTRQTAPNLMPRSCADLRNNGHSSNGLYSVVGSKFVETVYCDFTLPSNDASFQTWIGYADIKSVSTYFFVQRNTGDEFKQLNTPVVFNVEQLNVGGAMNTQTGKFTAPQSGKYFFALSGLVWFPSSSTLRSFYIGLFKNGNRISFAHSGDTSTVGEWGPISLQMTVNLKKADQIWMEIYEISPGVHLNGNGFTYFTGWLLEEDIVFSI